MTDVDIDALLAQARLPEGTVPLCLRGDLQAQWEQLERDLDVAKAKPAEKMVDGGAAREIAEQMEKLQEQMAASTVVFKLRAMLREDWIDLLAQHPAAEDSNMQYDLKTLEPALIRKSIIDPVMTDQRWETINKILTSGQYSQLSDTAFALNRRPVDVPFSPAASRMLQTSEPTSRRPSGSASA